MWESWDVGPVLLQLQEPAHMVQVANAVRMTLRRGPK
jgi:hypothetical protein